MKKTILLTGSTGVMGSAGLKELVKLNDKFDITLLVRPSAKNRRKMRLYAPLPFIRIVWGDLTCYEDVEESVKGADYVLHVGGMVSPKADKYPEETLRVNITAAENIVQAVKAQPNADEIRVVYIGSVAQTGHRCPPIHWGRTGDPINVSVYDHYAISKCIAERIFAESGLKHWVSLRQTGILYPKLILNGADPITFHVPVDGVLEWATVEDSGRLLARVCDTELPEAFWRRFYNISSGKHYRLTLYEFESLLLKSLSCPPPEQVFERKWFATRNFHGYWFSDADVLEEYLHFRANIPIEKYFESLSKQLPSFFSLAKIVPASLIKAGMKALTYTRPFGTMSWIEDNDEQRITAYFGSLEAWKKLPDWEHTDLSRPDETPRLLNHGYKEYKPISEWNIDDMQQAAMWRGGKCISESMTKGDIYTPLEWECYDGHRFKATPALILLGGHWCPECFPMPWQYDREARHNPFLSQVWHASHQKEEDNIYHADIFDAFNKHY